MATTTGKSELDQVLCAVKKAEGELATADSVLADAGAALVTAEENYATARADDTAKIVAFNDALDALVAAAKAARR